MSSDETHVVKTDAMKHGELVVKPGMRYFEEVSVRAIGEWSCSCGETFQSEGDARSHVAEQLD